MGRASRNPHLLAAFFGALLAGVAGVVAIVETDSWWVLGLVVAGMSVVTVAIVLDVWWAADDGTRRRRDRRR